MQILAKQEGVAMREGTRTHRKLDCISMENNHVISIQNVFHVVFGGARTGSSETMRIAGGREKNK